MRAWRRATHDPGCILAASPGILVVSAVPSSNGSTWKEEPVNQETASSLLFSRGRVKDFSRLLSFGGLSGLLVADGMAERGLICRPSGRPSERLLF
jgi:hypothetical protein